MRQLQSINTRCLISARDSCAMTHLLPQKMIKDIIEHRARSGNELHTTRSLARFNPRSASVLFNFGSKTNVVLLLLLLGESSANSSAATRVRRVLRSTVNFRLYYTRVVAIIANISVENCCYNVILNTGH